MENTTFVVPVSDEERFVVMQALRDLNEMEHVRFMSLDTIATSAMIKKSKVRHILTDLIEKKFITRYVASENVKLPRYYYVVEAPGMEFISQYIEALQEE